MNDSTSIRQIRRAAQNEGEAKAWWTYLPEAGPEAGEWLEDFERCGADYSRRLGKFIYQLRARRIEVVRLGLDRCKAELYELEGCVPPSIHKVMEVSFLTTSAYLHYHLDEHETAKERLLRAAALIEKAISLSPFLVPLAGQCYDFQLHFARIARARNRWQEMFAEIETGKKMVDGELPLCRSALGPVYLKDICGYYAAATPLNAIEAEALRISSDVKYVQNEFRNLCIGATVVPYVVVNWLDSSR